MNTPAFHHALVRDLHWLITSPELINLPPALSSAWLFDRQVLDSLHHLDRHPSLVQREIRHQSQYRLGLYFEDLVRIYLKYFVQPVELKSNIQVFHDKTTVGEYDFLLALKDGSKIHLETAVKFYLCTNPDGPDSYRDFIGPNRKDCLANKWQRLLEHQLSLSATAPGMHQASSMGLQPDQSNLLLKGYLFYPFECWQAASSIPSLNPAHGRGWWLPVSRAAELAHHPYRYAILMKPFWLSSAVLKWHATQDLSGLSEDLRRATVPLLIAQLSYHQCDGLWHEVSRGFIVPDDWNQQ